MIWGVWELFSSLGAGCAEPRIALQGGIRGNKDSQQAVPPSPLGGATLCPTVWTQRWEEKSMESAGPCACKGAFYCTRHIWGAPRALQHPRGRICIPSQGLFWLVNLFLWGVCVCLPQEGECSLQMGIWIPHVWKMLAMAQEKWSSSSVDLPSDRFISRTHFWGVMSNRLKASVAICDLGWH